MNGKQNPTSQLLQDASTRAIRYLEGLDQRLVAPTKAALQGLCAMNGPQPKVHSDPGEVK